MKNCVKFVFIPVILQETRAALVNDAIVTASSLSSDSNYGLSGLIDNQFAT